MSLAVVRSRGLVALNAPPVSVETHVGTGLPAFHVVGLPEAEVRESRERVRAALLHCGFDFPNRRITVSLAPADLPKASGRFDLPIALGILAATEQIPASSLDGIEAVGELSLSGEVRPIRGVLAMALALVRDAPARRLLLPRDNQAEARLVHGVDTLPLATLAEACVALGAKAAAGKRGGRPGGSGRQARRSVPAEGCDDAATNPDVADTDAASLSPSAPPSPAARAPGSRADAGPPVVAFDDLADVKGHLAAKRALEIAAAGGHSLLMVGPPGAGKSMLAQRFGGLLPALDEDEAMESATVLSLVGRFDPGRWKLRPYRAPHHTASAAAMVGGGAGPLPGEISLAHHGTLFLDELPEFDRRVLEALREPLETGKVTVSRAARQADFPARFQLIAAMNPCPCGYLGHPKRTCRCTPEQVLRYQGRISGPLMDRIDLQIDVAAVPEDDLLRLPTGETSATVATRVVAARARAQARQRMLNARLDVARLDRFCAIDDASRSMLSAVIARFGWSARAAHRVLRIARTIADLAGADVILQAHLAEAVQYRRALKAG